MTGLAILFAKEVFLDHAAANGMVEVPILLKSLKSHRPVDLLKIAIPK